MLYFYIFLHENLLRLSGERGREGERKGRNKEEREKEERKPRQNRKLSCSGMLHIQHYFRLNLSVGFLAFPAVSASGNILLQSSFT